jgi:hypothetical protein
MNLILTWIFCMIGQLIHLAVQIDTIARAKNNSAISRLEILKDRAIPIIARLFACTMIFGVFFGGGLPKLLEAMNMQPPVWAAIISILLSGTGFVGICISGLIGLALDSLITFIPMFKSYLPPTIDAEQAVADKGFAQGVDAAKQAVAEVKPPAGV